MAIGVDYSMADRFAPDWTDPKAVTLPNTAEYARPTAFDVTLKIMAHHDPLTDLKNRRAVLDQMHAVLSHPPRTGSKLASGTCVQPSIINA